MKIYCNKGLNTFFGNEVNNMTIMSNDIDSALKIYNGLSTVSIFIENDDNTIETLKGLKVVTLSIEMFKESNEILETGYIVTVTNNSRKETCFLPKCKNTIQIIEEGIEANGISRILDLSKEDFVYIRQNAKQECTCDNCRKKVLNQDEDFNQDEDAEMDLLSKTKDIAKRALDLKERFISKETSEEEELQYLKDSLGLRREAKIIRDRISKKIDDIEKQQEQQERKVSNDPNDKMAELINIFSQLIKKN